ncbi:MAG: PDZ domain-containing protein [Planctomycetes bacterium]|nr:PDZ domain-containing protein [Planctomycetota bacterium]
MPSLWALPLPILLLLAPASSRPEEPAERVLASLAAFEPLPLEQLWPRLEELKVALRGDASALEPLAAKVYELAGRSKLAGAALLYSRNEAALQRAGQVALQQLARDGRPAEIQIAAIRLLSRPARLEEAYLTLRGLVESAGDPEVLIEASLALWKLENVDALRAPMVRLLQDPRPGVREAAALALAETGHLVEPVLGILRALRDEPTDRGSRARLHLRLAERAAAAEPPPRRDAPPAPAGGDAPAREGLPPQGSWLALVAEVEAAIRKHSVRREELDLREIYIAALRGMVSRLDEHSAFQDPDDVRQLESVRLGVYWGLGAELVKPGRDAPLVVVKAHRGGPAFAAGLRSSDRILEVNGVTTHDRDRPELERLTEGKPGEEVHLLISRWGWPAPRMLSVERGQVEIPTLRSRMLPGRIGLIQVLRFGPRTAAELERALDALEAQGLQALVLDLRDNPGGNLKQAVRVVDMLVGERPQPIVTERAPGRVTEWSTSPDEKPAHPTAVLVSPLTASAAEVVAGALQDFRRAVVIGKRTFGKGVKQSTISLSQASSSLLGGPSKLLLTTGYLYLPLGRSIHAERGKDGRPIPGREGGVEPDIAVETTGEPLDGAHGAEIARVQFSRQVGEHVHRSYTAIRHLFDEGDVWDPAAHPGFEDLYASLGTRLSRSEVRQAVRAVVRRHLEEERGIELAGDWRDDRVLARAALAMCRALGVDPASVPEYRGLAERFEGEARARDE